MAPVIVFDQDNNPVIIAGSPGGSRIIPYMIKTIIAMVDWEMTAQEAAALPHFVTVGSSIDLEEGTQMQAYKETLEQMGHKVKIRSLNSGLHIIAVDDGVMLFGVDPRREGMAMGH